MRTFPQELVDKVIDELVELNGPWTIFPYSLISRAWVARTQQYCFKFIYLGDSDDLQRWCRKITPDPAGVSRLAHKLVLEGIDTLEGFEPHIRAFTRVEDLSIQYSGLLLSPSVTECFAPMGSSVVRLWIGDLETTSRTITSLLVGLPQLRSLTTIYLKVTDDMGGTNLTPRIPFFESNNSAAFDPHDDQKDPPGPPDWIPPSARFGDLRIDITYFLHKAVLVNQWLSNSCTILASLAIRGDPDGEC
jgi:hypothetical protein